ncbi:hypothetical protein KCP69_16690 [Salmonella enterica subsp. enterica]|nr:hypothetical protein KCP69_16690 [Salmonella enterica subsp. enterica]
MSGCQFFKSHHQKVTIGLAVCLPHTFKLHVFLQIMLTPAVSSPVGLYPAILPYMADIT